jgi:hypothetical protein
MTAYQLSPKALAAVAELLACAPPLTPEAERAICAMRPRPALPRPGEATGRPA